MNQSFVSVPCFAVSSFSSLWYDGNISISAFEYHPHTSSEQPMKQKLDSSLTECETNYSFVL